MCVTHKKIKNILPYKKIKATSSVAFRYHMALLHTSQHHTYLKKKKSGKYFFCIHHNLNTLIIVVYFGDSFLDFLKNCGI